MKLEEISKLLDDNKIRWRITRVDQDYRIITGDFRPERWNIEIDNDIVTTITFG